MEAFFYDSLGRTYNRRYSCSGQYVSPFLGEENEKPSTYIIPVIAKVFREHNIQAIGITTTDFDSMTAFQQKAVNEEIERLRKQSNLLLNLSCNTLAQGTSSEELLWRAAQWFTNETICGI